MCFELMFVLKVYAYKPGELEANPTISAYLDDELLKNRFFVNSLASALAFFANSVSPRADSNRDSMSNIPGASLAGYKYNRSLILIAF